MITLQNESSSNSSNSELRMPTVVITLQNESSSNDVTEDNIDNFVVITLQNESSSNLPDFAKRVAHAQAAVA